MVSAAPLPGKSGFKHLYHLHSCKGCGKTMVQDSTVTYNEEWHNWRVAFCTGVQPTHSLRAVSKPKNLKPWENVAHAKNKQQTGNLPWKRDTPVAQLYSNEAWRNTRRGQREVYGFLFLLFWQLTSQTSYMLLNVINIKGVTILNKLQNTLSTHLSSCHL